MSGLLRLTSPDEAALWCAARRAEGRSIGFVPTMGYLHEGHLSLVRRALLENDLCAVSVFVNPLQFDEAADLEGYPRDWEGDTRLLEEAGAQMVFTGTLEQFFPGQLDADGGLPAARRVDPGAGALGLEGACRAGHFDGVATIVHRLFEVVAPDRAYFGRKDLQQTLVVEEVAARRGGPEVVVCETSREPSGLARSSRNARLSEAERSRAACLSRALFAAARAWRAGEASPEALELVLRSELGVPGVELEYAAVRDLAAWTAGPPEAPLLEPVALVAARIGPVRLIDNHPLDAPVPEVVP